MELVAGMVFSLWAALTVPGKFLSILPQSDENRFLTNCLFIVAAASAACMSEGYCVKSFSGSCL